ncbi:GcrA cell cycle regulator [Mesorhizobium sp. CU2]|uniref:GcrA cell cycle regulator n=1 Tax=unclassified Mesorhizobium TaxID=325217 RepID=UPI001127E9CA|nr:MULTISPECIES: GcrA cell cycle regulator [unclassified Mesorhizobium]TPN76742.1 GcrA cell cycle regulator [Mesorhizobium sp. CU3]TPO11752.1 GcrA cell cycle regulator [Mesorhizobium sp. CU2]
MPAYTEKEIDEIAAWLKEGLSASRIAGRFSALRGSPVSRNAIIGIVHRNTGLKAIGFANPKGGHAGGRPRKNVRPDRPGRRGRVVTMSEPAMLARHVELAEAADAEAANLPPRSGDVRQDRGARCPADLSVVGNTPNAEITARPNLKKPKPRKSARTLPPAWLAPSGREKSEACKLPAPPPPVNPGRQPHVAAMRFLDCLFGRCRAPLDLALRDDAEDDPAGARPGPEMLCCGLRTTGTRSYCTHHHARFHGHRRRGI